jgi:hypothetical protein
MISIIMLYILIWWWFGCSILILSVHLNGNTVDLKEIIPLLYMGLVNGPTMVFKVGFVKDE